MSVVRNTTSGRNRNLCLEANSCRLLSNLLQPTLEPTSAPLCQDSQCSSSRQQQQQQQTAAAAAKGSQMADSEDKTAAALKKVQIFEAVSIVVAHHCVCASRAQTLMSAKFSCKLLMCKAAACHVCVQDIPEDLQKRAIERVSIAIEKYTVAKDIATDVKKVGTGVLCNEVCCNRAAIVLR
eukprot:8288-Heterococcus_DN1.PRE.2